MIDGIRSKMEKHLIFQQQSLKGFQIHLLEYYIFVPCNVCTMYCTYICCICEKLFIIFYKLNVSSMKQSKVRFKMVIGFRFVQFCLFHFLSFLEQGAKSGGLYAISSFYKMGEGGGGTP